jgi:hypothetical protein
MSSRGFWALDQHAFGREIWQAVRGARSVNGGWAWKFIVILQERASWMTRAPVIPHPGLLSRGLANS